MAKLTAKGRGSILSSNFALPGRRYPLEDKGLAKAALSEVSQHGTPAQKPAVRAKVHSKYPGMGKK